MRRKESPVEGQPMEVEKARMKLEDLDYELLKKVVATYDQVTGGRGSSYLHPRELEEIKDSLRKRQPVEYRFGSKLTMHSKLWIRCVPFSEDIEFSFDPNISRGDKEDDRLAEEIENAFDEAISRLLQENRK